MTLRAAVIEIEAAEADALSDALLAQGALATTIEDPLAGTPAELPVYDSGFEAVVGWKRARIRALLSPEDDAAGLIGAAACAARLPAPPCFELATVPDEDWVGRIQAQFAPLRISDRLWIVPSWCRTPAPAAVSIALDPGLAFGTGSHPTSKACLQWLERHVFAGARVLDYGCGSGILAIAAMKLGAASAVGVDVDAAALEVARSNAAANAVRVGFVGANEPLDFRADLVVANILAGPLKMLAPLLAARCVSQGRIALAGILERQADEIIAAYRPWFDLAPFAVEDGWVTLGAMRR
jgi:ribosomal protein L11 methyltransferase